MPGALLNLGTGRSEAGGRGEGPCKAAGKLELSWCRVSGLGFKYPASRLPVLRFRVSGFRVSDFGTRGRDGASNGGAAESIKLGHL